MPDENHTAIGIILDKSGSMEALKDTALSGYNEFVENQKASDAGKVTLTRTVFDDDFPPQITHETLSEATNLTDESYQPGGLTALFDAVGYTIDEMGRRFDSMNEKEKPENVLVCIVTDGGENASSQYSAADVRGLIKQQQNDWGWEFIYIGAGVDDFDDASAMGVGADRSSLKSKGRRGFRNAVTEMTHATRNMRRKGVVGDYKTDSDGS